MESGRGHQTRKNKNGHFTRKFEKKIMNFFPSFVSILTLFPFFTNKNWRAESMERRKRDHKNKW